MTNLAGVFAGGDTKRGASLIVWVIAEGRGARLKRFTADSLLTFIRLSGKRGERSAISRRAKIRRNTPHYAGWPEKMHLAKQSSDWKGVGDGDVRVKKRSIPFLASYSLLCFQ